MVTSDRLRKAEIFQGLSEEELKKAAPLCQEQSFPKGAFLCEEGSRAEKFFILEEGSVSIRFQKGVNFWNRMETDPSSRMKDRFPSGSKRA